MARIPRIVVPGVPHHITQRGSRRLQVFFDAADYDAYRSLASYTCAREGVEVLAYCFIPNHVHWVAVPPEPRSLALAFGKAHERYAKRMNAKRGWSGHLWQERFHSSPMDERHTLATIRYVLMNPVRAGLVNRPEDWPYSSARAMLGLDSDSLINLDRIRGLGVELDWLLNSELEEESIDRIRLASRRNLPLGGDAFVSDLENRFRRSLRPRRVGRPCHEDG